MGVTPWRERRPVFLEQGRVLTPYCDLHSSDAEIRFSLLNILLTSIGQTGRPRRDKRDESKLLSRNARFPPHMKCQLIPPDIAGDSHYTGSLFYLIIVVISRRLLVACVSCRLSGLC